MHMCRMVPLNMHQGYGGRFKERCYPHHGMYRTTRKRQRMYTFLIWQDVYRNNNNNKRLLLLHRYTTTLVVVMWALIAHVDLQQQQQAWYFYDPKIQQAYVLHRSRHHLTGKRHTLMTYNEPSGMLLCSEPKIEYGNRVSPTLKLD